jgi:putative phage-type endonuclease
MNIVNLIQGSAEWHAHRALHDNASDAPAMMGESKYKTRSELLHERYTGLKASVDAATQKRFDDGHRFEALARPYAEKIVGKELFPITGVEGRYSASFDGIDMDETVAFEHKSLNDELREVMFEVEGTPCANLPLMYRIQMEQQLMISGAEKVLFMASKWDGDKMLEERHCWYYPDLALRQQIIDGWAQFEKDLADYVPPEVKAAPETKPAEALPVPSIQVRGEVTLSNLDEITPKFDVILANINTTLSTDEHFAQANVDAKACREAADNLKLTAKAVINQIAPVSEAVRTLEDYAVKFDALGLKLEKAVDEQKKNMKDAAITTAKLSFRTLVTSLESEISPIRLNLVDPDFATAIKGVKTIATMHDRINTTLAQGKADAEAKARDIRNKMAWLKDFAKDHMALFSDLQQIIFKADDDFQLLVKTRISEYQTEQERKIEAERARIRAEEEAKAAAKLEVEAKASQEATTVSNETTQSVIPASVASETTKAEPIPTQGRASNVRYFEGKRPTDAELIDAVATAFAAKPEVAEKWLTDAFGMKAAA